MPIGSIILFATVVPIGNSDKINTVCKWKYSRRRTAVSTCKRMAKFNYWYRHFSQWACHTVQGSNLKNNDWGNVNLFCFNNSFLSWGVYDDNCKQNKKRDWRKWHCLPVSTCGPVMPGLYTVILIFTCTCRCSTGHHLGLLMQAKLNRVQNSCG